MTYYPRGGFGSIVRSGSTIDLTPDKQIVFDDTELFPQSITVNGIELLSSSSPISMQVQLTGGPVQTITDVSTDWTLDDPGRVISAHNWNGFSVNLQEATTTREVHDDGLIVYRLHFIPSGAVQYDLMRLTIPLATGLTQYLLTYPHQEDVRKAAQDFTDGQWNWFWAHRDVGAAVTPATDLWTTTAIHGYFTGQIVTYTTLFGAAPTTSPAGGLVSGSNYYASVIGLMTCKLHPTLADAIAGTNSINCTDAGGFHTLTATQQEYPTRNSNNTPRSIVCHNRVSGFAWCSPSDAQWGMDVFGSSSRSSISVVQSADLIQINMIDGTTPGSTDSSPVDFEFYLMPMPVKNITPQPYRWNNPDNITQNTADFTVPAEEGSTQAYRWQGSGLPRTNDVTYNWSTRKASIESADAEAAVYILGNLWPSHDSVMPFYLVATLDPTTDIWTTAVAHGWSNGDGIAYLLFTGSAPVTSPVLTPAFASETLYYAGNVTATTLKLYTTSAAAIAGTSPINFSDSGGSLQGLTAFKAATGGGFGGYHENGDPANPTFSMVAAATNNATYVDKLTNLTTGRFAYVLANVGRNLYFDVIEPVYKFTSVDAFGRGVYNFNFLELREIMRDTYDMVRAAGGVLMQHLWSHIVPMNISSSADFWNPGEEFGGIIDSMGVDATTRALRKRWFSNLSDYRKECEWAPLVFSVNLTPIAQIYYSATAALSDRNSSNEVFATESWVGESLLYGGGWMHGESDNAVMVTMALVLHDLNLKSNVEFRCYDTPSTPFATCADANCKISGWRMPDDSINLVVVNRTDTSQDFIVTLYTALDATPAIEYAATAQSPAESRAAYSATITPMGGNDYLVGVAMRCFTLLSFTPYVPPPPDLGERKSKIAINRAINRRTSVRGVSRTKTVKGLL